MFLEEVEGGLDNGNGNDFELSRLILVWSFEEGDKKTRDGVQEAVENVIKEYPEAAKSSVSTLVELLEGDEDDLRRYASGIIKEISEEYPKALEDEIDSLLDALSDTDETVRENAESSLTNVAEEVPDKVVGGFAEKSEKGIVSGD
ncbi:MAG: hypothetical protein SXQ77_13535 [Halobacteria archaeon]|nr:hypothetical protein [Halobacteria archaeon]